MTIASNSVSVTYVEQTVIDAIPVGVLIADDEGRVIAANRAWSDLSGLGPPESIGDRWWTILDAAERARLRADLERVVEDGVDTSGDYRLAGKPCRWLRWRLRRRDQHDGSGVVMAVIDVTADRDREAALSHRATHDGLTGLVSHDEFLVSVDRALRRRARHPGQVVVVFVDLDGFKTVNDRGGHLLGDRVLAMVAHRLRDAVRPEDVVARVGGDEFAVLCADVADSTDAAALAERIEAAFATPIDVDGVLWAIGATVGVALADQAECSAEGILGAADRAMYDAKVALGPSAHGRRNRIGAPLIITDTSGAPVSSALVAVARAHDADDISTAVADSVVQALHTIGLALTRTLETTNGLAHARLEDVIDLIDQLVHDVHASVFDHAGPSRP